MRIVSGFYTGNGRDDRTIYVGFQPDIVWVWKNNSGASSDQASILRNASYVGDLSSPVDSIWTNNHIQAFSAFGFQIGSHVRVNEDTKAYSFLALKADGDNDLAYGTYVGNGADDRNITFTPTFTPDFVLVVAGSNETGSGLRTSSHASGWSKSLGRSDLQDVIQAFGSGTFQVGTRGEVNNNGDSYAYIAFKNVTGKVKVGVYTGNGVDDRNITGMGFNPNVAIISPNGGVFGNYMTCYRGAGMAGDLSHFHYNRASAADCIQSFITDGFQVGTDVAVNENGQLHYYVAMLAEKIQDFYGGVI